MKITIEHIGSFKKDIEIKDGARIQDVLDSFKIKYDFVITMVDDKVVPINKELVDGDALKVVTVVSGG